MIKDDATEAQTQDCIAGQHLNLRVKSDLGQQMFFRIKQTTLLKKLMDYYCQKNTLNPSYVRFIFSGVRITDAQTPKQLNMQNNDEIQVFSEQFGG